MVVQGPAGPGNYNTAGKRRQNIAVGSTRSICGDGSGVEFQLVGSIGKQAAFRTLVIDTVPLRCALAEPLLSHDVKSTCRYLGVTLFRNPRVRYRLNTVNNQSTASSLSTSTSTSTSTSSSSSSPLLGLNPLPPSSSLSLLSLFHHLNPDHPRICPIPPR
ncbi:uncharacterized protein PADG_12466 [Paracoccidioides brasiliensis Pb18]|uniref:Uncharacterized protein n=1 Tax=Paracoccidioides brasiliensis (strain Pb18) TaxID=502780 RepID=A0A0A0HVI4_PARBD|nr:uncharacterized protein PADG_12466 [Paracoccidioides brasiliensis Pb18]KGM91445.1 hypothetical protein PADG_12466 [Paracoccidioides brasiliensis Pb18]